jgi:hypothetical protein
LNREAVDLSDEEIRRYLQEVFDDRLRRHRIEIEATSDFDGFRIHAFPSTLLATFVNVVDNAIYWISSDSASQKLIRLNADPSGFTVWNGGLGIDVRVADRIFEFGETTKVGERGIWLCLSRQSLRREGLDLTLEVIGKNSHPMFRIGPTVGELNDWSTGLKCASGGERHWTKKERRMSKGRKHTPEQIVSLLRHLYESLQIIHQLNFLMPNSLTVHLLSVQNLICLRRRQTRAGFHAI